MSRPGQPPPTQPPPSAQSHNEAAMPTSCPKTAPVLPATNSKNEESIKSFQTFINFIFSVSVFGASTFAIIASQMADPADVWKPNPPPFHLSTVRNFLAVAWLCFILSIAIAGYSLSILTLLREGSAGALDKKPWAGHWARWNIIGLIASTFLHLLLVMAFLSMSLALAAYVGAVGWVATGFCSLAAVFVMGLSVVQVKYAPPDSLRL